MKKKQLIKYQRNHLKKGRLKQSCNFKLIKGNFAVIALENGNLTTLQLEAIRRIILFYLGRKGKIWFSLQSFQGVSSKGLGIRMGSGKGGHSHFVNKVQAGSIICEIEKLPKFFFKKIIKIINAKLPIAVKGIYK